ncbi:hypothetical protein [Anaerosporobacter sp.]|uniref:hypothetical protein n=1 Tax=Anaerosporobacter sp. TaxID=1872529 RepID=UPI00286F25A8|nr:hypothetical protein [Anaerosporobacter sp.]
MVVQYKCPCCGADMKFDSITGKLLCESCSYTSDIDTMQRNQNGNTTSSESYSNSTGSTSYGSQINQYICNNCGAVLITEPDTTATTCNFCGAPVVLADRLSGESSPHYVIPFQINKEQAQEAFKKWCKKGRLTPAGFMTADRIKSMTGLYVPFWLYDLQTNGEMNAACTHVSTYEQGDYIVTETKHYNVHRSANLSYLKVPVDASAKMNDQLMDKLEPFDYRSLKHFNMPYLAGYVAEKYNYTDKDLFPRVQARVANYVETYLRSSITGYSSVSVLDRRIHIRPRNAFYALLPVWLVAYDYKDSEHVFAMNGQTGKIVGRPPLSKGKIFAWFGGITAVSFAIIKIIALLAGGGF